MKTAAVAVQRSVLQPNDLPNLSASTWRETDRRGVKKQNPSQMSHLGFAKGVLLTLL